MTTKKMLSIFLSLSLIVLLVGCGGNKGGDGQNSSNSKVENKKITLNLTIPDYKNRVESADYVGEYTGEVNKDGLPDGKGKFLTISRDGIHYEYEGSFKNGHFDGEGKFTIPGSEEVKEGNFVNDSLNGAGKITFKRGNKKETIDVVYYAWLPMNPNMVDINKEVQFANWTYKVKGVKKQKTIGNEQSTGDYLIVTVNAFNGSAGKRDCDIFELANLKTGAVFNNEMLLSSNYIKENKSLSIANWYVTEFEPNEKKDIIIAFDIPANTDINDLVLTPKDNVGIGVPIKLVLTNTNTEINKETSKEANDSQIKVTEGEKIAVVVNCKEWISLRSTPSVEAEALAHIPLGTAVKYIGPAENGFYCIEYNGQRGYGLQSYLVVR